MQFDFIYISENMKTEGESCLFAGKESV